MKRADIKVGFACNNHCTFCVQGDKRYKYKPRTLDEIKKIILDEYNFGAKYVVFTGGEPTVHPNLIDAEIRTESYADYRWSEGKSKGVECSKCIKNDICEGPWKEYPDMYGWEEFIPIK